MYGVAVDTRIQPQDTMARFLVVEAGPLVAIVLESALGDFGYHVLGPVETLKAAAYYLDRQRERALKECRQLSGAASNENLARGLKNQTRKSVP